MQWVTLCVLLAIFASVCPAKTASKPKQGANRSAAKLTAKSPGFNVHSLRNTSRRSAERDVTAAHSFRPASRLIPRRYGRKSVRTWMPPRPPAPTYQLHPDEQRYQTIQKALADRGFFKGEANGQWGDDSVDALKRFQLDQKLLDDGKIDSLSLIALGLGPKHDSNSLPAVQPPGASSESPITPPAIPKTSSSLLRP